MLDDVDPQWIQLNIWPDLAYMRSAARRNARIAAENLKKRYDSRNKAKYKDFAPGDQVWLRSMRPNQISHYKIERKYIGPCTIVASPRPGFHLLRFENEVFSNLVPETRLKIYYPEEHSALRSLILTEVITQPTDEQQQQQQQQQ